MIERVLDTPARSRLCALEVRPRAATVEASAQQTAALIPVRLSNRGQHAEAAEGPARTELVARVFDQSGRPIGPETASPMPGLLLPRADVSAAVWVTVPEEPGAYQVALGFRRLRPDGAEPVISADRPTQCVTLRVTDTQPVAVAPPAVPANLEPVLRAAAAAQQVPDGYADVSEGRLARWKCWLKRKLLHNFQQAYVDVLSRQQSAFNRQVLNALSELGDGQAALTHFATANRPGDGLDEVCAELRRLRRQNRRLRRRLARLEAALAPSSSCDQESPA
jgi:hypothetical protein